MKLIKHIPYILKDYFEIIALCNSLDVEIENIEGNVKAVYTETIVNEATIYGIERYEKIYDLLPEAGDSLQTRRKRIINKITNRLPYTIRWLINRMNILVGEGNYLIDIKYDEYDLLINISGITTEQLINVQNDMKFMLPANLIVDIKIQDATSQTIFIGGFLHIGIENVIKLNTIIQ